MKIKRGFSRKLNLGNYETCDFWAEFEGDSDNNDGGKITPNEISNALFQEAKEDVEKSIEEFLEERENEQWNENELKIIEMARKGVPIKLQTWEILTEKNPKLANAINEAKKEYRRGDEYKSTLKLRNEK